MKKIKIGVAGLGRLGRVHANNIAYKIPYVELTAAAQSCRKNLNTQRVISV